MTSASGDAWVRPAVSLRGFLETNHTIGKWLGRASPVSDLEPMPLGVALEPTESPTRLRWGDRLLLNFGTNNYLAATHDESVRLAAANALALYGTGSTASRLAGGTSSLHLRLEQALRDVFLKQSCIVFSSGYTANLVPLSVLGEKDCLFILDEECHASIYDACHQTSSTIVRFKHNDMADLTRILDRVSNRGTSIILCVEGLYSMSGDRAPLREILDLKKRFEFLLFLDEAHSFGTIGRAGLGLAHDLGVVDQIDFLTGTFSKAFGSSGGFAVCADPLFEVLRFAGPSYMYTASLSPVVAAAALAGIERVVTHGAALRSTLEESTGLAVRLCHEKGISCLGGQGPIIAVPMHCTTCAAHAWRALFERGVYVNLILPPAAPRRKPLLRISFSTQHRPADIAGLVAAMASCLDHLYCQTTMAQASGL